VRILIRTSRWAIWARRLGSIAVPLIVISVVLHRFRLITSDLFLVTAGLAGTAALLALVVSLVALARLWQSGDQGWNRALLGLVLALLCLLPFGWYGNLALRYPAATDISTTSRDQLPLVFEPGTAAMPAPRLLTPTQIAATFPNVATRTYRLGTAQVFALVQQLVADNGWTVRLLQAPDAAMPDGRLNAQIMTLPGWREEVVLRVAGNDDSATVDMRSASLNALHDFGNNGLRIESFLRALDEAVTTALRDGAIAATDRTDETDDETPAPVEVDDSEAPQG
jgi:hypothetical protein